MGSKRVTMYLRESTVETIGQTLPQGLSQRVAAMLARYERICRELMPTFTRAEWCAIMDANNGGTDMFVADAGDFPSGSGIWANIHDTRGLGAKWEIDQAKLVKRLQKLSAAELLAVDEAIARFWNLAELDTDEALERSWARVEG